MTRVPAKRHSIEGRLVGAVLALEVVSLLIFVLLALNHESRTRFRAFEQILQSRAMTLFGAVADADDAADNVVFEAHEIKLRDGELFDVEDAHGQVLGRSDGWQATQMDSAVPTKGVDGIYRVQLGGRGYRFALLHAVRVIDPLTPGGGISRPVVVRYGAPVAPVWIEVIKAVCFYAGASMLLLAGTGVTMTWLLRRGLAPLHALAEEAGRISSQQWEFAPPASAREYAELAPLTQAIETALGRLQRSFEQQRRLTSDAAHELKTGLAIAKSSLQLLALRPRTAVEYREGLDRCLEDTQRLEETVAKMLTLARVEDAASRGATQGGSQCDGAQVLRSCVQQLQGFAALRGLEIRSDAPPSAWLPVREDDFTLLSHNLLLNALQHSRGGGSVEARLTLAGEDHCSLTIEDRGTGIPLTALPHIFEPFFRSDAARDRKTGGTGLGLAICKGIVEASGGSIVVDSEPGRGTVVRVELPLAAVAPDHARVGVPSEVFSSL